MGKVIEMKKRCPRCGKPVESTEKCTTGKCITSRIRKQQKGKTIEIPSIKIVLCEREAKALKENPSMETAMVTIARAAVENYVDGLPKQCPKTGKPHRWETNYDETFCGDCHMDVRGSDRSDKGKPYVKILTLHYKTQNDQPYGSESRKCSECGRRLWVPDDGAWTENHAVWKDPPKGFINCRQKRERELREAQERR